VTCETPLFQQRLVLKLIAGLNENYDGVAIFIQQSNPLSLFHEARSRLLLEETRKAKQAAATINAAGTALLTQTSPVMTILVTIVVLPKVPEIQHTVIILVKNAVRTKTTIAAEMVAVEDEVAVTTDKTVDSNTIHVHGSNNSGHLTHNGDRGDNNHGQLHLVLTPHSIRFVHHQIVFPWLQELVHHMLTMLMSQLFQIMHLQTSM